MCQQILILAQALFADDLVACVSYQHLEDFLAVLHEVSTEYELRINPKKCAIYRYQ